MGFAPKYDVQWYDQIERSMSSNVEKTLQRTLIDAVDFFDARDLPYALVGRIAASMRGRTRVTEDVDIAVRVKTLRARHGS